MNDNKLTIKNYLGYALVDVSGMLAFSAIGSYISVFYTDILKISPTAVFVIMLLARLWDGIDDPVMGTYIQNRKPDKNGKYRTLILIGGISLSVMACFTMFKIEGLSTFQYAIYAGVTYIIYGILYSLVLLPYGSMPCAMTRDEKERSTLSMCRSIGGGIGSLPATILFPLLVFTDNVLDKDKLFIAMAIMGVIMIVLYVISFLWTKEYIETPIEEENINPFKVFKSLIHNKAFMIMSIVCCLHMAVSLYINTTNIYLFKDYFAKPGLLTLVTVASYIPMLVLMLFANRLIEKFGKKVICIAGLSIASLTMLIAFVFRIHDPYLYIIVSFFVNVGVGFMTLEVWALALDVVDAQELQSGKRQEAIVFSVFTFMRKLGQALAALSPLFVGLVGYNPELVGTGQNINTLNGMYTIATLVPLVIFVIMLVLMLNYPIGKKQMEEMKIELKELRDRNEA